MAPASAAPPGQVGVGGSPRHSLRSPPSQGSPKPQASWTHNGHALDGQRVSVRSGDRDSILFIRSAQRSDSGRYELTVSLKGLEAKAAIDVLVIGRGREAAHWRPEPPASYPGAPGVRPGVRPGGAVGAPWAWGVVASPPSSSPPNSGPAEKPGPPGSIRLLDVWGCNAALEWVPPQDTGNAELLGYTVQKADRRTGVRPAAGSPGPDSGAPAASQTDSCVAFGSSQRPKRGGSQTPGGTCGNVTCVEITGNLAKMQILTK